MTKIPELLAPAGNNESFFAAVENGANAVYLGLKQLSARASATNFSLDELARLLPFAHQRHVSIYVALNSLVTAPEFPGIMNLLQSVSDLGVDALIVQDPGIIFLARKFFPSLKLHASTLMTVHNSAGVDQLQRMGVARVVLAREVTMKEIQSICSNTKAELEIFVHGALCFSYSGLCLTSSFRGGHSGLQGRCVQPCRLRFRQGKREGFFLSCNDFSALPLIPELKKLRLAAFKIEGRMKSAEYVGQIVKAYRHVLDAREGKDADALAEAMEWLAQTPSRRLTSGFLGKDFNDEILTPHRSGSIGLWLGTVKAVQKDRILVLLRHGLQAGDRLRPESKEGREKEAFNVVEIFSPEGHPIPAGDKGRQVLIRYKGIFHPGERLFKVGSAKSRKIASPSNTLSAMKPLGYRKEYPQMGGIRKALQSIPGNELQSLHEESFSIKVGTIHEMMNAFRTPAGRVFLTATRENLERIAKLRLTQDQRRRFVWAVPTLLMETRDIDYYRRAIGWFTGKGFLTWELDNWGHFDLFEMSRDLTLIAGARFNLRNHAALAALSEAGCRLTELSLEITLKELRELAGQPLSAVPIVSVYAWPPLFVTRLSPRLEEGKPFATERKDLYFIRKKAGGALIYADHPISWFDKLPLLRQLGFRHFLIDASQMPDEKAIDVERLVSNFMRTRSDDPRSVFNFDREP